MNMRVQLGSYVTALAYAIGIQHVCTAWVKVREAGQVIYFGVYDNPLF